MLYEVITIVFKQETFYAAAGFCNNSSVFIGFNNNFPAFLSGKTGRLLNVITSYSIHYTKLYDVDGYVEEVNEDLINYPHLANKSPYEKGWLVLLRPTRLVKNLKKLFYGADAIQWFDVEMYRLAALITSEINRKVNRQSYNFV